MTTSEEKVDTSTEYMTEYEKWAVSGVKEPKNLLKNLKVKQNNKQNGFVEKMRNRFLIWDRRKL